MKSLFKRILARKKLLLGGFAAVSVAIFSVVLACNLIVGANEKYVFENTNDVPETRVALVLGTAPTTRGGSPNVYFASRMRATKQLFDSGKIEHIIVSGDNRWADYNEPQAMKNALMQLGVPADKISCDYAGLRTLDSVVRARKVFGQEKFVIVSQAFHCERAVYLARAHGCEAYGFVAENNPPTAYRIKLWLRERLARVAAVADILLLRQPKHLGEPEILKISSLGGEDIPVFAERTQIPTETVLCFT